MIVLECGPYYLAVAPEMGGAVVAFSKDGRALFRDARAATSVLDSACYPLVPYCNRVPDNKVRLNGREWAVEPNFGDQPLNCHGDAWQSAWNVDSVTPTSLTLTHECDTAPWRYQAIQSFSLSEDAGLTISLRVTNFAEETMPFGLGFHPFFPDPGSATVKFASSNFWLEGPQKLPTEKISIPPELSFKEGRAAPNSWRNNCYSGWDGGLEIEWADGKALTMTTEGLSNLHVFSPLEGDFFCFEPQSHVTGAIGWSDGEKFGIRPVRVGHHLHASVNFCSSMQRHI